MKHFLVILGFLSCSYPAFAQEDTTIKIQSIQNLQNIQTIEHFPLEYIVDCAHGHICCAVGCGCCTELARAQIYDTVFNPLHNGVQRITVVERYMYANWHDLQAVHYRFRTGKGKWSEKFYPAAVESTYDFERMDKKLAQYSGKGESNYTKTNRTVVYTASREYLMIDLEGKSVPMIYHTREEVAEGVYLSSILVGQQRIYGLTDSSGNQLCALKYVSILPFDDEGIAIARNEHGYLGLLDKTGKEVVACKYGDLRKIGVNRFAVNSDGSWEIIDGKGKAVSSEKYHHLGNYSEGLVMTMKDDETLVYLDWNGKEVIQRKESWGYDFHDGMAAVTKDKKWGFIDTTGKLVIDFLYYSVHDFYQGVAPVAEGEMNNEHWVLINKKGKVISTNAYTGIDKFKDGLAQAVIAGKGYGLVNTKGKEVMPCIYVSFQYVSADSWFANGVQIRSEIGKDSSLEMINQDGKLLLDLKEYVGATFVIKDFNANTFYPFILVYKPNDRCNMINYQGKKQLNEDYNSIAVYSDEIAIASRDKEWFLIDLKMKKIIKEFGLDHPYRVENGVITVEKAGEYYQYEYFNMKGEKLETY